MLCTTMHNDAQLIPAKSPQDCLAVINPFRHITAAVILSRKLARIFCDWNSRKSPELMGLLTERVIDYRHKGLSSSVLFFLSIMP